MSGNTNPVVTLTEDSVILLNEDGEIIAVWAMDDLMSSKEALAECLAATNRHSYDMGTLSLDDGEEDEFEDVDAFEEDALEDCLLEDEEVDRHLKEQDDVDWYNEY